ncbi:methylmalonyl-CoA decarboxylase [Azonexus hydrophilus]|uniref:methylmalonyl-CoA decarboxylase n=1 Tax=Azonexus hydrophilus TaxID=418702 RepID=UPI00248F70BC|nr:methylmalonyl-CoA decarboxylase [Azonexus hydrophilus]
MSLILASVNEGIGTITLNHDLKRNALSEQLVHAIATTLADFREAGARVAILRAQPGAKVWSAGHDVAELPLGGVDPLGWQDPLRMLIREVEAFPAPVIALIEGSVWGGACELVFACDMIVATPEATFAATPAKLGVPYNATGLLTFLNAAPPHIAKELLFTSRPMTAARLERQGIINHVVPVAEITAFTHDMAQTIAHNSPLAIGVMKEQLRILAAAHALSPADFERIQGLRRVVYNSRDYAEGINSFKEKRTPVYRDE